MHIISFCSVNQSLFFSCHSASLHGLILLVPHIVCAFLPRNADRAPTPSYLQGVSQTEDPNLSARGSQAPLPTTNLIHDTTIQLQHLTIDIPTPREEDDTHRHLLVAPRASSRHFVSFVLDLLIGHVGLVVLVALLHGHLARKVPRRNAVHPHAGLGELLAHHARQVRRRGFGGVVAEMRLRVPHHARHAADDDDAARQVRRGALQQRQERHDREEHGRDVRVVRGVPVVDGLLPQVRAHLVRVAGVRVALGAGHARGRDDQRQVLLARLDFLCEFLEVGLGRHVAGADGDDFAAHRLVRRGRGRVCLCGVLEDFSASARDVDSRSYMRTKNR